MRHHSQVASVGRADACNVVVGAVRIARIAVIVVLGNNVVLVLCLRQVELSFAVSHPDAQLLTTESLEHHAVVLGNLKCEEGTLELMGVVVEHTSLFLSLLLSL